MLRNPYIAGVERFEAPFSTSGESNDPLQRIERAAHFCILLWQQFQPELRTLRYTLNYDHREDATREFTQQPGYDELIDVDFSDAQQIDIELVSQQSADTGKYLHSRLGQEDEHFPALLEVFIPLRHEHLRPGKTVPDAAPQEHLVIWCRPDLLSRVTRLLGLKAPQCL